MHGRRVNGSTAITAMIDRARAANSCRTTFLERVGNDRGLASSCKATLKLRLSPQQKEYSLVIVIKIHIIPRL